MTSIFIYIVFSIIVGFDIYLAVKKKQTITSVFRGWYETFIFVPYAVGFVFLGHFINLFNSGWTQTINIALMAAAAAIVLMISIVMRVNKTKLKNKLMVLPIIGIGYFLGDLLW